MHTHTLPFLGLAMHSIHLLFILPTRGRPFVFEERKTATSGGENVCCLTEAVYSVFLLIGVALIVQSVSFRTFHCC